VFFGQGAGEQRSSATPGETDAVTIAVAKRRGANAIQVSHHVLHKLEQIKRNYVPQSVNLTVTRDYGETAAERSNELLVHMGIAVLSVTILMWFALGKKEAWIVAVSIPITLSLTLASFVAYGFTLNRVTFFALIFSIGILVDDAIVVVERSFVTESPVGGVGVGVDRDVVRVVVEVGRRHVRSSRPFVIQSYSITAVMEERMNRVAVVTGGASGLGLSICEHLARQGRRVAVLDLDLAAAEKAADALRSEGAEAVASQVDVSDRAAVDGAFARVRADLGPIHILVTSAAVSGFVPLEDLTLEDWNRTIAVNLTGTFHCVQAAIADMVAAGWGRIVTISSSAGQTGSPRQADYSASKGGVIALTKTVAREYAARGITANTIPPFSVDTPMMRAAQDAKLLPPREVVERMIPAGRLGTPDDIAAACAFLCSDEAGYLTGQVIAVNGGAVI
jgi:NAD(P)-dependent dehydrogenase (short-subunit alcohol dehydrogenase family)